MAPHANIDLSDSADHASKPNVLRRLLQPHGHYRKSKQDRDGPSALHSRSVGSAAKIDSGPTIRSPYLWRLSSEEIREIEEAVHCFESDDSTLGL